MPEGGFLEQKSRSPGSLIIVIALHVVGIGALAMSKMEVPVMKVFDPLKIRDVTDPPPPPPEPEPLPKEAIKPKSVIDTVPRIIPLPTPDHMVITEPRPLEPSVFDTRPPGKDPIQIVDPPKPLPPPVRTEAQMDSRSELQPPYPAVEERQGNEGSVTVRLTIGADGRVKAVEKVRATSDAFFVATERHALKRWRFKPATVDGKPVESRKTMTVTFRIEEG